MENILFTGKEEQTKGKRTKPAQTWRAFSTLETVIFPTPAYWLVVVTPICLPYSKEVPAIINKLAPEHAIILVTS